MQKRQEKKNKLIICLCFAFTALNFLCFGILQKIAGIAIAPCTFVLAGTFSVMVYLQFVDSREGRNTRGRVYVIFTLMSAVTIAYLHISFSWWILALFVLELGIVITLIIRFRPVV